MKENRDNLFFDVSCDELIGIIENNDIHYGNIFDSIEKIGEKMLKECDKGEILHKKEHSFMMNIEQKYEKESIRLFGDNSLKTTKIRTLLSIIHDNMNDRSLRLLFIGAIVSLLIGFYKFFSDDEKFAFLEGISILTAISIIVAISSSLEYSQEKIFQKLEDKKSESHVKIVKNGVLITKTKADVIVGDLVFFEPGDILCADMILTSTGTVFVDESMLTGESIEILKNRSSPILFSGSNIKQGSGKGLVIAVGKNSTKGKILESMEDKPTATPLQRKTNELADNLITKSIEIAVFIFIIKTIKCLLDNDDTIQCHISNMIDSIALAVTIIPEGLFMATTMALSFASKRLLKENNLVRDLSACEKMNSVQILCTDKTGTLTYNRLKLRSYYAQRREFFHTECKDFIHHKEKHFMINSIKNIVLNSTAFKNQEGIHVGSRIESALLEIIEKMAINIGKMRKITKFIAVEPFSSDKMYMSTITENNDYSDCGALFQFDDQSVYDPKLTGKYMVFFKGIPEKIIERCEFEIENDNCVPINSEKIRKFSKSESKISQIRLATAFTCIDEPNREYLDIENVDNLIFTGCFSFEDPLRDDIDAKISTIQQAGIEVVMLTGDGAETAKHIAEICGISNKDDQILTGKKFRKMDKKEMIDQVEKIRIIARATPQDKQEFVKLLQKRNKIVAVTGDGTNDGPALKLADVGFCMGINASDVARDASSIVLLKDDFASIISAISWGRCMNDSIRKFLQLQFTATSSTILQVFFVSIFAEENDNFFKPIQLLWINLYMDAFSSISLTSDSPLDSHLTRKPEKPEMPLITGYMTRFIALMTFYITSIMLCLNFFEFSLAFKFNTFYFCLISTQICSRSISVDVSPFDKILQNSYIMSINLFVIIAQILIVQKFYVFFFIEPLDSLEWLYCLLLALSIFPYYYALRKTALLC